MTYAQVDVVRAALDPMMSELGFEFAGGAQVMDNEHLLADEFAWEGSTHALATAFPRVAERVEYFDTGAAAVTFKLVFEDARVRIHIDGFEIANLTLDTESDRGLDEALRLASSAIRARSDAERTAGR